MKKKNYKGRWQRFENHKNFGGCECRMIAFTGDELLSGNSYD